MDSDCLTEPDLIDFGDHKNVRNWSSRMMESLLALARFGRIKKMRKHKYLSAERCHEENVQRNDDNAGNTKHESYQVNTMTTGYDDTWSKQWGNELEGLGAKTLGKPLDRRGCIKRDLKRIFIGKPVDLNSGRALMSESSEITVKLPKQKENPSLKYKNVDVGRSGSSDRRNDHSATCDRNKKCDSRDVHHPDTKVHLLETDNSLGFNVLKALIVKAVKKSMNGGGGRGGLTKGGIRDFLFKDCIDVGSCRSLIDFCLEVAVDIGDLERIPCFPFSIYRVAEVSRMPPAVHQNNSRVISESKRPEPKESDPVSHDQPKESESDDDTDDIRFYVLRTLIIKAVTSSMGAGGLTKRGIIGYLLREHVDVENCSELIEICLDSAVKSGKLLKTSSKFVIAEMSYAESFKQSNSWHPARTD